MKGILIFVGGFVIGVLTTIFIGYFIVIAETPIGDGPNDDGLVGLTIFPEKGECVKTTSKMESTGIEIFQVLESNMALGNIENFTYIGKTRYDDFGEEIVVLLINYDGKTYFDDQKIDVTNKCVRQIGIYQYTAKNGIEKTVPAVLIE
ncbi:MAG: hypothetical protein HWE09_08390 [Cyclobacteriaceae bacterium]|nr:hypothetical protein [Cyclobacteriaceae bacterium]